MLEEGKLIMYFNYKFVFWFWIVIDLMWIKCLWVFKIWDYCYYCILRGWLGRVLKSLSDKCIGWVINGLVWWRVL